MDSKNLQKLNKYLDRYRGKIVPYEILKKRIEKYSKKLGIDACFYFELQQSNGLHLFKPARKNKE
jgi:hypothetical protein